MQKDSQDFLYKLLETPSVSGFEQNIQRVVRRRASKYADTIEVDVHGNLIAALNPKGRVKVMLAGHCDQIGMMITHIDDKGYLYFRSVGGLDPTVIPGSRVTVYGSGGPIQGIIGLKAVHLKSTSERGKQLELKDFWIDIGATDGKEAKSLVSVGDVATYALGAQKVGKHCLSSPGCDDRVGVFVVMEALRLVANKIKGKKKSFPVALYAVSTVQEEIGLRGARTAAYAIDPQVGIAVDVTHASDCPTVDPKEVGTVNMGDGPTIARGANINPVIGGLLEKTAKKKKIKWQPLGQPGATGTDANAIQVSKQGVAAALIGIPNRYMHTQVEIIDTRDLEAAAKLIAETVMSITTRTSFIPS